MCKREFWNTFSYFNYEIFRKNRFFPEISIWTRCGESNKKDVDEWTTTTKKETEKAVLQLFTATAFWAAVEHVFLLQGLVQSSLWNKLGNDKASKFVFLFKLLNKNDA